MELRRNEMEDVKKIIKRVVQQSPNEQTSTSTTPSSIQSNTNESNEYNIRDEELELYVVDKHGIKFIWRKITDDEDIETSKPLPVYTYGSSLQII